LLLISERQIKWLPGVPRTLHLKATEPLKGPLRVSSRNRLRRPPSPGQPLARLKVSELVILNSVNYQLCSV